MHVKMQKAGVSVYIIVGLGNPGKTYENTRHNIGFDVIDVLAEQEKIGVLEKKHKAVIGRAMWRDKNVSWQSPRHL